MTGVMSSKQDQKNRGIIQTSKQPSDSLEEKKATERKENLWDFSA